jgi:hypothetical protein
MSPMIVNSFGFGAAPATPILPTAITGLWAWYKRGDFYSDAGSTLQTTNGGSVQQWSDSSGLGHHLSRTTQKPTVDTGTTHLTKNTLHFSPGGSFQALNFPAISNPAPSDGEYFLVAKAASDAPSTNRVVFELSVSGGGSDTQFPTTAGHVKEGFAVHAADEHDCGAQTLANDFHVLNSCIDSAKVLETRLDSVLIGNPSVPTYGFQQTAFLGTDGVVAHPWDGWIFELVIFTAKLSSGDRAGLYVYLTT